MDPAELERRLRVLEDTDAIRQLKARYFAACDRKDPKTFRACFADGAVRIDYGKVGSFDNADALVKVFTQMACHDHMVEMHHGSNPQIEVLDAQRARGTWSLHYQLLETKANTLTQLGGYYEDEYRRSDPGGWKIVATKFTVTSTLSLDLKDSAVKALFAGRPPG